MQNAVMTSSRHALDDIDWEDTAIRLAAYVGYRSRRWAIPADVEDVVSGLVKAAVFGFIIALMGCYHGFNSRGGAQGVGRATTNAVVSASILILVANYLVTEMFFAK